jgi:hypothetical protein
MLAGLFSIGRVENAEGVLNEVACRRVKGLKILKSLDFNQRNPSKA